MGRRFLCSAGDDGVRWTLNENVGIRDRPRRGPTYSHLPYVLIWGLPPSPWGSEDLVPPHPVILSPSVILSQMLILSRVWIFIGLLPTLSFGFPYGSQKALTPPISNLLPISTVRGVNLGGWLVTEPWITPSLFDNTGDSRIVDEWTFCEFQDRTNASAILKTHWDTWITEADFAAIAAAGLNHVRVPIGYWAFDVSGGEPFIQGQVAYLWKAVSWAQAHGLKVIIDLHGAPGSQNGYDNSGQRMRTPQWHTKRSNVDRTTAVIQKLASMFADNDVVPIIAPLNEPAGYVGEQMMSVVKQYWYDSYKSIRWPYRTSKQSHTVVMIHDAYQPLSYWKDFMPPPNWHDVVIDAHIYEVFSTLGNKRNDSQHIQTACSYAFNLTNAPLQVVVGEWTPAPNDCTKYLNGRGVGSRYEGTYPGSTRTGSCTGLTGKASTFSQSYKDFLRKHWEAQVITFEKGQGWIQWTWKAEETDEWSYQAGLANGWIPQNPTDFMYPDICA